MALKRLFSKAILMTLREKKLFVIFTLIYTILIFLTSIFIDVAMPQSDSANSPVAPYLLTIFFVSSAIFSVLYAYILVAKNRRQWAVLKCIGYTNGDVNKLISGTVLFTTFIALIINIELLFHFTAIVTYLIDAGYAIEVDAVLVDLSSVIIVSLAFLGFQILAILIANSKILKVRPIIALKKVGE
ncbi:MAG: FtsX-like permease family protein [Promethearchaeota archaeon]